MSILSTATSTAAALLVGASAAHAQNGTWTDTNGGLWSAAGNWSSSVVANGAGNIANFSTVVPTAANTVINLDTPRTIGQITFGSTTVANSWNLSNNSSGSNILTLNNGASQPIISVTPITEASTISATIAGTDGFIKTGTGSLILAGSNTYSGQTTLNSTTTSTSNGQSADLYLANNNALGTSTLYIDPGSSDYARVILDAGVVINNNIIINTSRVSSGSNGTLMANNANGPVAGCTINGSVTINNIATSGGHIDGPLDNTFTDFLTFNGPITLSPAYYAANPIQSPSSTGKGLLIRGGNVILAGGGSYHRAEVRSGMLRVGATNGIATNAYLDMGINANGNPASYAILDLNGFNQSLVGIEDINGVNSASFPIYVTNMSTTPATLTLTPLPAGNISAGLVFQAGGSSGTGSNAFITDNSANGGVLNVVINGDPTGVQTFNTPVSNYNGSTTLTSGTLNVNTLNLGGATSSIGASSNVATNLVFNGGALGYTGGNTSTDRNFTINTGTTGTIGVTTAATTLSITGGGIGGGGLIKTGPGTLALSGSNAYTGATSVNGGTLLVNSPGTLAAASSVTVSSGATLGGNGTISGLVTPAAGGTLLPGTPGSVGTLTVGAVTLNTGSILNFQMTTGGNSEITVANSGGLTVNGGSIDLYNPGTTTTFSSVGTYTLFNVTGAIGGSLANLVIADPAAGKAYGLVNDAGAVNLTIASATTLEWNDNGGTQTWNNSGNWIGGVVPDALGQSALFGSNLVGSNSNVTLSAAETVSGLIFNNSGASYSLGGSGSIILNNGVAAGAIDILNGQHSINVPISLLSATALDTTNATDVLSISGNITGPKSVAVNGPGTVVLSGTNGFTSVAVNGSTLDVGNGTTGTLGTGPVTLTAGATLNFNVSSGYNFGQSITGSNNLTETVNQLGPGTVTVGAIGSMGALNVSNGSLVATTINSGVINVTGSGSLTASGNVSGGAKLTVNTTGSVLLGGSDSYAGGTEVDNGTLTLNNANAFPAGTALAVNGGTLDLHGNSISIDNILDTGPGGVITNSASNTTSTIAFSGFQANYNIYAAINDGPNGGKVALSSFIENLTSSPDGVADQYTLILNSPSNYSGGTTVLKQSIQANASNAFGTGPIVFNLNVTSTNNTRLYVIGGITLPNNITFVEGNPYAGYGDIQYVTTTSGSATLTGSITIDNNDFTGGTFAGPTNAGDVLNVDGPVYAAENANTISVRSGNVGFAGGGTYANLVDFSTIYVNATNGICPTTQLNFYQGTPVLDLNGNSQTLGGLTNNSGTGVVQNSNSSNQGILNLNTAVADVYTGAITGNVALIKSGPANLNLSGVLSYTGNTQVSGGSLTFANSATGSMQTFSLPGGLNLGAGTLTNVQPPTASSARTVLQIGSLNLSGASSAWTATLDLNANDLDVQNGNLATITNQVKQGFSGGTWNGSGGILSTAAAADTTHLTALGVIQNSLDQTPSGSPLYGSFDGNSISSTDVLVKYTYYGDANLSGTVDASDYSLIDNGYLNHLTGWYNGDFNYDGVVNGSDYTLIDNAFNMQGASLAAVVASPTAEISPSAVVPEPATLGLLGLAMTGLLGRRQRRC